MLDRQEYWPAVDLFEEVLAKQPDHAAAREGAGRGRLLARWSTRLTGAGSDPARLRALGDSYALDAPDLAGAAYAASFAALPAVETLDRWLHALADAGDKEALVDAARSGMQVLRPADTPARHAAQGAALAALENAGAAGTVAIAPAIVAFIHTLAHDLTRE